MDPLSFTASLVTLVQLTATVGKDAVKLYREVKDAPKDLEQTSARVLRAQARVSTLVRVYQAQLSRPGFEGDLLISPEDLTPLRLSIQSAQSYLDDIQQCFTHYDNKSGKRVSLRWTFRDKETVTKLLRHLREIEGELNTLIVIVQIVISTATFSSVNGVSTKQDAIIERIQDLTIAEAVKEQRQAQADDPGNLTISAGSRTPPSLPPIYEEIGKVSVSRPKIWGKRNLANSGYSKYGAPSSVALNVQWNDLRSAYIISGTIRMPSLLSGYAVTVHARLDLFKLSWPSLSPTIQLRNTVARGSEFITACRDGDVAKVQALALARRGSPTDVDEFGKPALHHAIDSGSCRVVKFLLNNGATANELDRIGYGPLQLAGCLGHLDMFRGLLVNGACVDHVDSIGRTPLSELWNVKLDQNPRVEFVESLLAFSSFLTMNCIDELRVDPLFLAARTGTADDIKLLIRIGASLQRADDAMMACLQRMDLAIYDALIAHTPANWVNRLRGRTGRVSLHKIVSNESSPYQHRVEMLKRVLAAGGDVHVRDSLGWTPEDLAKANDMWYDHRDVPVRCFDAYLEALRSFDCDVSVDDEGDIVWPANENRPAPDQNGRVTQLIWQPRWEI